MGTDSKTPWSLLGTPMPSLWWSVPALKPPEPVELIQVLPGKAVIASLFQKKLRKPEVHLIYFIALGQLLIYRPSGGRENGFCDVYARP